MNEQPDNIGRRLYSLASRVDKFGVGLLRLGLVIVLLWIGALKFTSYEAEGIVPIVSNSPLMSFFYHYSAPEYQQHMNRQGEVVPSNRSWHAENGTYPFSQGLGAVIIAIGFLIALHPLFPRAATLGSFLLIGMSCVTLTFLVTTPEAWVPPLGDTAHGFPFLSGVGTAIVKDVIMLGASVVTMADSAARYLNGKC